VCARLPEHRPPALARLLFWYLCSRHVPFLHHFAAAAHVQGSTSHIIKGKTGWRWLPITAEHYDGGDLHAFCCWHAGEGIEKKSFGTMTRGQQQAPCRIWAQRNWRFLQFPPAWAAVVRRWQKRQRVCGIYTRAQRVADWRVEILRQDCPVTMENKTMVVKHVKKVGANGADVSLPTELKLSCLHYI